MEITQSRLNRLRAAAMRAGQLRKSASITNADGTITPTADDCELKFPTLAAAREYLETKFNGHGIIFDKNGKIIKRCRCRHGSDHMVQVTGELESYTGDYGVKMYRDKPASRKTAAAVLTPEAEQAAVQPPMDPAAQGGMPADPSMAPGGPMPPQDPAAMGGMPPQATGSGGGQIPPEILQDQQFIMWLQQQGVVLDPQSGMFIDQASGQPLPADAIMQAYQVYQQQMAGAQGGMPPQDPAAQGGAPAQPPPQDPAAMGGMPPQGAAPADQGMGGMPPQGGALPPEILQDQQFMDFMTQAMGAQFDGQQFIDPTSGQAIPPDLIVQAYQQFQQQMAGGQGGMPPQNPAAGGMPDQGGAPSGLPPEIMDQLQSAIDASIQNYTAQLDKKIETLLDKLETVKQALESMRDTDDERDQVSRKEAQALRDEIAADLTPSMPAKTASENSTRGIKSGVPRPINMLELLRGK